MHVLMRLRGRGVANAQDWRGDDAVIDAAATRDAAIRARERPRPHFYRVSAALTMSRRDA
jgi:hypothetical protein